jgi:hypothetical protein
MNQKEKQLAKHFLKLAAEEFGNHGCNDVSESVWDGWSVEERQKFVKEYYEYNGDPEEYNPKYLHIPDYAIMSFLAFKLTKDE